MSKAGRVTPSALTPPRARCLDRLAGDDGIVVGMAVDHRDSFTHALRGRGLGSWDAERITAFKELVVRVLAPAASMVLLDVESVAAQAVATGSLPGSVGLAVPLEAQGYEELSGGPQTTLLEEWDAERSALLGADACKLLLPFRTDLPGHADVQAEIARTTACAVHAAGLALILEPVVFDTPSADQGASALERLVVSGAAELRSTDPDVLKLQYPGSRAACRHLTEVCDGIPWVLLGGGTRGDVLEQQLRDACWGGASGFIVGRTLFNEALVDDPADAERILLERSLPLLERLGEVARKEGTPWRRCAREVTTPPLGWHRGSGNAEGDPSSGGARLPST